MNAKQLIIKCYAEQEGNVWSALCLDFNIAAQGDSFEEAKTKLEAMIGEYVYDTLVGEDRLYANQLLTRRAPLSAWLRYYVIKVMDKLFSGSHHTFHKINTTGTC